MGIFDILLVHPLLNLLIFFYNLPFVNLGIAIILLTTLIKILLFPFNSKTIRFQKKFQDVQIKMREIQERYKNNIEVSSQKTLELFKKEKVNPFMGILPILVQIPIMIALFILLREGIGGDQLNYLYGFIYNPEVINPYFLGENLSLSTPLIWALFTGIIQLVFSKVIQSSVDDKKREQNKKRENFRTGFQKYIIYILPIMTFFILLELPAALAIYWITNTILSIIQHLHIKSS